MSYLVPTTAEISTIDKPNAIKREKRNDKKKKVLHKQNKPFLAHLGKPLVACFFV